jgi:hypothetical protein
MPVTSLDTTDPKPPPGIASAPGLAIVVVLGSSVGSSEAGTPRGNGVSSTTFTQAFVGTECPGRPPWIDEEVERAAVHSAEERP